MIATASRMPNKRVHIEEDTWRVMRMLAHDTMKDFQELADEAFGDLLKKYNRPTRLKAQLNQSVSRSSRPKSRRRSAA